MRLRYDNSTAQCRKRFDRVAKLGKLSSVRGYRYRGRYNTTHEAVLIKGENGSIRFGGLLWGYGGEGPRGLVELLGKIGVSESNAQQIAFTTARRDEVGTDWEIKVVEGFCKLSVPVGEAVHTIYMPFNFQNN